MNYYVWDGKVFKDKDQKNYSMTIDDLVKEINNEPDKTSKNNKKKVHFWIYSGKNDLQKTVSFTKSEMLFRILEKAKVIEDNNEANAEEDEETKNFNTLLNKMKEKKERIITKNEFLENYIALQEADKTKSKKKKFSVGNYEAIISYINKKEKEAAKAAAKAAEKAAKKAKATKEAADKADPDSESDCEYDELDNGTYRIQLCANEGITILKDEIGNAEVYKAEKLNNLGTKTIEMVGTRALEISFSEDKKTVFVKSKTPSDTKEWEPSNRTAYRVGMTEQTFNGMDKKAYTTFDFESSNDVFIDKGDKKTFYFEKKKDQGNEKNFSLFSYQYNSLKYAGNKILLAHRPGFGKTKNALILAMKARNSFEEPKPKILLILKGPAIMKQWVDEVFKMFPNDKEAFIWQTYEIFQNSQCDHKYPEFIHLSDTNEKKKLGKRIEDKSFWNELGKRKELYTLSTGKIRQQQNKRRCLLCNTYFTQTEWKEMLPLKQFNEFSEMFTKVTTRNKKTITKKPLTFTLKSKVQNTKIYMKWRLYEDQIFICCRHCVRCLVRKNEFKKQFDHGLFHTGFISYDDNNEIIKKWEIKKQQKVQYDSDDEDEDIDDLGLVEKFKRHQEKTYQSYKKTLSTYFDIKDETCVFREFVDRSSPLITDCRKKYQDFLMSYLPSFNQEKIIKNLIQVKLEKKINGQFVLNEDDVKKIYKGMDLKENATDNDVYNDKELLKLFNSTRNWLANENNFYVNYLYKANSDIYYHMYRAPKGCIMIADEVDTKITSSTNSLILYSLWKYSLNTKYTILCTATPLSSANMKRQLFTMAQVLEEGEESSPQWMYQNSIIKKVPTSMGKLAKLMKFKMSRHNTVGDVDRAVDSVMKIPVKITTTKQLKNIEYYQLDGDSILQSFMGEKTAFVTDFDKIKDDLARDALSRTYIVQNKPKQEKRFPDLVALDVKMVELDQMRQALSFYQPMRLLEDSLKETNDAVFSLSYKDGDILVEDGNEFTYKDIKYLEALLLNNHVKFATMSCVASYNNGYVMLKKRFGGNPICMNHSMNDGLDFVEETTPMKNWLKNWLSNNGDNIPDVDLKYLYLHPVSAKYPLKDTIKVSIVKQSREFSNVSYETKPLSYIPYVPDLETSKIQEIVYYIEDSVRQSKNVMLYFKDTVKLDGVMRALQARKHKRVWEKTNLNIHATNNALRRWRRWIVEANDDINEIEKYMVTQNKNYKYIHPYDSNAEYLKQKVEEWSAKEDIYVYGLTELSSKMLYPIRDKVNFYSYCNSREKNVGDKLFYNVLTKFANANRKNTQVFEYLESMVSFYYTVFSETENEVRQKSEPVIKYISDTKRVVQLTLKDFDFIPRAKAKPNKEYYDFVSDILNRDQIQIPGKEGIFIKKITSLCDEILTLVQFKLKAQRRLIKTVDVTYIVRKPGNTTVDFWADDYEFKKVGCKYERYRDTSLIYQTVGKDQAREIHDEQEIEKAKRKLKSTVGTVEEFIIENNKIIPILKSTVVENISRDAVGVGALINVIKEWKREVNEQEDKLNVTTGDFQIGDEITFKAVPEVKDLFKEGKGLFKNTRHNKVENVTFYELKDKILIDRVQQCQNKFINLGLPNLNDVLDEYEKLEYMNNNSEEKNLDSLFEGISIIGYKLYVRHSHIETPKNKYGILEHYLEMYNYFEEHEIDDASMPREMEKPFDIYSLLQAATVLTGYTNNSGSWKKDNLYVQYLVNHAKKQLQSQIYGKTVVEGNDKSPNKPNPVYSYIYNDITSKINEDVLIQEIEFYNDTTFIDRKKCMTTLKEGFVPKYFEDRSDQAYAKALMGLKHYRRQVGLDDPEQKYYDVSQYIGRDMPKVNATDYSKYKYYIDLAKEYFNSSDRTIITPGMDTIAAKFYNEKHTFPDKALEDMDNRDLLILIGSIFQYLKKSNEEFFSSGNDSKRYQLSDPTDAEKVKEFFNLCNKYDNLLQEKERNIKELKIVVKSIKEHKDIHNKIYRRRLLKLMFNPTKYSMQLYYKDKDLGPIRELVESRYRLMDGLLLAPEDEYFESNNRLYFAYYADFSGKSIDILKDQFERGGIDVILTSDSGIQGVDYKSCTDSVTIAGTPVQMPAKKDQFDGRLVRANSHSSVPNKYRVVHSQTFCSKTFNTKEQKDKTLVRKKFTVYTRGRATKSKADIYLKDEFPKFVRRVENYTNIEKKSKKVGGKTQDVEIPMTDIIVYPEYKSEYDVLSAEIDFGASKISLKNLQDIPNVKIQDNLVLTKSTTKKVRDEIKQKLGYATRYTKAKVIPWSSTFETYVNLAYVYQHNNLVYISKQEYDTDTHKNKMYCFYCTSYTTPADTCSICGTTMKTEDRYRHYQFIVPTHAPNHAMIKKLQGDQVRLETSLINTTCRNRLELMLTLNSIEHQSKIAGTKTHFFTVENEDENNPDYSLYRKVSNPVIKIGGENASLMQNKPWFDLMDKPDYPKINGSYYVYNKYNPKDSEKTIKEQMEELKLKKVKLTDKIRKELFGNIDLKQDFSKLLEQNSDKLKHNLVYDGKFYESSEKNSEVWVVEGNKVAKKIPTRDQNQLYYIFNLQPSRRRSNRIQNTEKQKTREQVESINKMASEVEQILSNMRNTDFPVSYRLFWEVIKKIDSTDDFEKIVHLHNRDPAKFDEVTKDYIRNTEDSDDKDIENNMGSDWSEEDIGDIGSKYTDDIEDIMRSELSDKEKYYVLAALGLTPIEHKQDFVQKINETANREIFDINNYTSVDVPSDGNCMFHAILRACQDNTSSTACQRVLNRVNIKETTTTTLSTEKLRTYIVENINNSSCTVIVNILRSVNNFNERVQEIGTNGKWGGDVEIQLINCLFGLPITVINAQTNRIINMQPIDPDGIILYYVGNNHYEWLKKISGEQMVGETVGEITIEEEYNE